MWLKARQDSKGQYLNESIIEIADKIEELREKVKDGSLVPEGKNDVLAMALGKPEHDGRVRGAGKYFTPTSFFDIPRRVSKTAKLEAHVSSLENKLKKYEAILIEQGISISSLLDNVASNGAKGDNGKKTTNTFDKSKKRSPYDGALEVNSKKQKQVQSFPLVNNIQKAGNKNKGSPPFHDLPLNTNTKASNNPQSFHLVNGSFVQHRGGNKKNGSRHFHDSLLDKNKETCNNAKKVGKATNDKPSKPRSHNGKVNCWLALESKDNIVAKGFVFPKAGRDEKIHTVPLGDENVRVSISVPIVRGARLPIPIEDEYTTVESAIGVPVAWPKEFVITDIPIMKDNNILDGKQQKVSNEYANKELNKKHDVGISESTLRDLATNIEAMDPLEQLLPLEKEVFEIDVQFHISKDEVLDVCGFQMLTADCVIAYIRYLYETYPNSRRRYGFCYPADISQYKQVEPHKKNRNEMHLVVKERLKRCEGDQIIFLPFYKPPRINMGPIGHWVLAMIDLKAKEVYYFDSQGADRELPALAIMLKCALVQFAADSGIRTFEMDWKIVKCPIQEGGFECGYYVLKFMKHFVEDPTTSLKIKLRELAVKQTFTNAELSKTRFDLLNYVIPFLTG